MFEIIILMFMPFLGETEHNAIRVTSLNNQALEFKTQQECHAHIALNLGALQKLAEHHYPRAPIASIECMLKAKEILN
jgi:Ni2+-binding GTPase involved in maturation of urease and hydrogenase